MSIMDKEKHITNWMFGTWNKCTRYLVIPMRRSNQLSYEATDAGSWSFVGLNVPVRNETNDEMIYEIDHIWNMIKVLITEFTHQLRFSCVFYSFLVFLYLTGIINFWTVLAWMRKSGLFLKVLWFQFGLPRDLFLCVCFTFYFANQSINQIPIFPFVALISRRKKTQAYPKHPLRGELIILESEMTNVIIFLGNCVHYYFSTFRGTSL